MAAYHKGCDCGVELQLLGKDSDYNERGELIIITYWECSDCGEEHFEQRKSGE